MRTGLGKAFKIMTKNKRIKLWEYKKKSDEMKSSATER